MRFVSVVILGLLAFAPSLARAEEAFPSVDSLVTDCVATSHAALCGVTVESFRADYVKAQEGDYPAQRNVAFCLKDGCDGAVVVDTVLACAWRMVIQGGDGEREPTERRSYEAGCGALSNGDRRSALQRAEQMFSEIYKREMPIERLLR